MTPRVPTQPELTAAACASGRPVLDAGRGQPDWIATVPRAAFFRLGAFAVTESAGRATVDGDGYWGGIPDDTGIADRLAADLGDDPSFLRAAVDWVVTEFGVDPDAFVGELVRGVLGAGYPTPQRILRHLELVMERYAVTVCGADAGPPGRFHVFATEGGAAAMAYTFRTLRENGILGTGDKIAIASPVFTPYLKIPDLEHFGVEIVEVRAAHNTPYRFDEGILQVLRDPKIKAFVVINPGNPDTRAMRPERLREIRDIVAEHRPDLILIADTVYATFVDGFRGLLAEVPRNVICLHSFSKNFGATGNRLGFVAVAADTALDTILSGLGDTARDAAARRYSSVTADPRSLPFLERMVAESREVALHNIAGLATPDQVQMGLFALAHLMPDGARHAATLRAELGRRHAALLAPLGVPPAGGQDSQYYALVDLLSVARVRHGADGADRLHALDPSELAVRLADAHGVVVLPGAGFDAASWDVRVCLAALPASDLRRIGEAIVTVLDELAAA